MWSSSMLIFTAKQSIKVLRKCTFEHKRMIKGEGLAVLQKRRMKERRKIMESDENVVFKAVKSVKWLVV